MTADEGIPLVSAIVLSFNRKEETLECLRTLSRQTYEHMEVVVVDNGSRDGSADAIEIEFKEVKLIRLPENLGAWGPRDTAISASQGKYVFMIDSDAVCEVDAVAQLVQRMEKCRRIGIIQPRITDMDGEVTYNMGFGRDQTGFEFYRWQFHGCAALIRREAYDKAGGFPHHYLVAGGEAFLSIPLLDAGYRILYFPSVTIRHALSPKERIPRQRFFMSNLHRMQNLATFNPFVLRVTLDFIWKCGYFAFGCVRYRYLGMLPWGLWMHGCEFFKTIVEYRRPVSRETQRLVDYLAMHQVRTTENYEDIDPPRTGVWSALRHRFREF